MNIYLAAPLAVTIKECDMRVAHVGKLYGNPEDDSEGRAMVFGDEGNFFAGYATKAGDAIEMETYVIESTTSYALLSQAAEAAVNFTRYCCEAKTK